MGFLNQISSLRFGCEWSESENPMHRAIELRKAKRYPVSAPALFMWAPKNEKSQSGRGVTRDINTSGVYIQSDAMPPVGALVQLEILLPKLGDTSPGMHLQGEGIVLRCDYGGASKSGFAASAQFYPDATNAVLLHMETTGQVV